MQNSFLVLSACVTELHNTEAESLHSVLLIVRSLSSLSLFDSQHSLPDWKAYGWLPGQLPRELLTPMI